MTLPWQDFSDTTTDTASTPAAPDSGTKPWEDFAGGTALDAQHPYVGPTPYEQNRQSFFESSNLPPPGRPIPDFTPPEIAQMKYAGRDLPSVVESPGQSVANAIIGSVGKVLPTAGNILAAGGEDIAEGIANLVHGVKTADSFWRNTMSLPSPFTEDIPDESKPTPYESELQQTGGVTKLSGELATGITKTVPQLFVGGEIAGGAKALGFTEQAAQALGMGTAFGFDKDGFNAKQAAIMAAFPGVAEYGGKLAEATLAKVGVKPTTALAKNAVNWLGSLAGSQAYMDATQAPQYLDPKLTPEQKRDLFVNNLAQNIAFHLYSLPGMAASGIAEDAIKAAADTQAKAYADVFWKQQEAKKVPDPDKLQSALTQLYSPVPERAPGLRRLAQQSEQGTPINREEIPTPQTPPQLPTRAELNNRIRQQLKPVPTVNRMRVPRPQPTGEPNAVNPLVQPEGSQQKYQGTSQGQNVQPNAPEEGQTGGGQAGGGNSTVGAATEQNAPQITAALTENMQGRSMDLTPSEFADANNPHLAKVVSDWNRKAATTGLATIAPGLTWQKLADAGVITATKTDAGYQVKVNSEAPGGGLSTKSATDQAKSNAVQDAMRSQAEALKRQALTPQPDWRVIVTAPHGEHPGHVQIANSDQQGPIPTIENLKAAGHDVPDFSKLPQGSYTWAEAADALKNPPTPAKKLTASNVNTDANVQAAQSSKPLGTQSETGGKVAREQKKFLLDAIDQATKEAPEAFPRNQHDEVQTVIDENKHWKAGEDEQSFNQRQAENLLPLFEKYGEKLGPITSSHPDGITGSAIGRLELAVAREGFKLRPKVTIEVPGDGTFDIINTKKALADFKQRAARFPTSKPRAAAPPVKRSSPTPPAPVGKLDTPSILRALEPIVSEDATRPMIHNVWSDGERTVATNGRMLTVIEQGIGGSKKKPLIVTVTGKPVTLGKDEKFPSWQQVVPEDFKESMKGLDSEQVFRVLRQAQEATTEKANSVRLYRNKDGSLGVSANAPELGSYEHNVSSDARTIMAIDPKYLISAINAARRVGDTKLQFDWTDELAPLRILSDHAFSVIMPMRMSQLPEAAEPPQERPVVSQAIDTATGPEAIRELLVKSGLPARVVQVASAILDEPALRNLDWSRLTVALRDRLEHGATGISNAAEQFIALASNARADTFPHEVFHLLYEALPERYRAALDELRLAELKKIYGDNIPQALRDGMTSDEFVEAKLPLDQYPLSSATEFLADFAGKKFATDQFTARNQTLLAEMKAKVTGWVRGIVNAVKRVLRVRPDLNQIYSELLSGTWTPTPDTARAYDDNMQAQLVKTRTEYEKQREFEEPGAAERALGTFGDVVEMKRKIADDLGAGERARKMTMLTNQELLTQLASTDMAVQRLAFGNYEAMRQRTEGSDQGLRSGVIVDAWRGMNYEQHRMAQLRDRLAQQEAVVESKKFKDMLGKAWEKRAAAESAAEIRKTFTNQIATETGEVIRQIAAETKNDAKSDQLRNDLARLEKLPEFTEAVAQRVNDIINTVGASEEGVRLLSGLGSKNGTEIYRAYLDLKESTARVVGSRLPALSTDQKVFAQLASAVLAANGELRMKLLSLEYARMHPEFQAQVTDFGEKFRKAFEKDPGNAIKQLTKQAARLKANEMTAGAAWLRLNRTLTRELTKLNDLQEAVEIDNRTVASPEWKQLVNQIIADNSKLSPTFRIPDEELAHVSPETVWNEFTGKQQFRSPTGGVYDIDLGFTRATVQRAQDQMKMFLGDTAAWLEDPKNADSPDRNYWNMRYDFVNNVLNTSTVLKPAAIYGALGIRSSWGMQQYLFEGTTLPAARIAGVALNNWKQAWAIQDQWFQDTAEMRTRLGQAAKSHRLNPDMDMQRYREDVWDRLASEYRHGKALKAGDRLNNGIILTKQDIAAFKLQGQKINELFNMMRNVARSKVMQDGLLIDDFLGNVFAVRAPQEIGAEPGTTLPHEFSARATALAKEVALINPGATDKLKALLDQPNVFNQFVQRFIAERRADYSVTSPFEELYKQIAQQWRNGDVDAPRSISEIADYIVRNTPEEHDHAAIEKHLIGEMEDQLRKFYRNFIAKEAPSDVRANRASKSTAFTKGFQREVGSSFFYEYGATNARETRSIGLDSTNFQLVRYVRSLDAALESYRLALAKYEGQTGEAAKVKLAKASRADFKSGADFRDYEQLQSEASQIAKLKDMLPRAYGTEQIMSADLFGKLGRFTGDFVGAALSGPLTMEKVFVGSINKMGFVLGNMERWYSLAYLKGLIATVFSTVETTARFGGRVIAKAPGHAVEFARDVKADGVMLALSKQLQEGTEGFFQAGRFFNQQYQFGMGFKSPAGFRAMNILSQPYSHGGYYDPKFSRLALIRMPQKAFYQTLKLAEAPLEVLKSLFPQIGYAISYDAAARTTGWTIDAIGSQARRSFEFLEKTGGIQQYDLQHPSDLKNILPVNYVLPVGIFPKGESNLYQARNLWERSIDIPLNEMVINYWRKLAATPKAERGSVSFLASDIDDPAQVRHVEDVRAAALMKAVIEDVHHATVANRPIQFRLDSTLSFLFPLMRWTIQTVRGTAQAFGKAPADSRNRLLLAAASTVTAMTAFAMVTLLGETEKQGKKAISEGLNGEAYGEKTLTEAKTGSEAAKLALIDSVSVLPYAHNIASQLLGESAQTVNDTGMSVFSVQKLEGVIRYMKGVINTGDPTYGMVALAKSTAPFLRPFINRLESQQGLVALKNARTIVQKNGPEDLLGKEAPSYREPTELTPLKQALSNAVFKGDPQEVASAGAVFVAKAQALGKTPEEAQMLLRDAMASIDPIAIGGRKMTDAQHQTMLSGLNTSDAATLAKAENNWQQANQALGLTEQLTKQPRETGGGGSAGAIALPGAGRNQMRRVSNRFRLPRRRSTRSAKDSHRIKIAKLRLPSQRFRAKKPRNRLRRRSIIYG
jgi:hypothetical protein